MNGNITFSFLVTLFAVSVTIGAIMRAILGA